MNHVKLDRLPVFWSPPSPPDVANWQVAIEGHVEEPTSLSLDRIKTMPATDLTVDFRCEEGCEVPQLRWTGVTVASLLSIVRMLPGARYLGVGSGGFVTWLPLSDIDASQPVLAYLLDREPVPWEHGGPLRLVLAAGLCYQSVKWVDRIELAAEAGVETAEHIAMDRLQS